MNQNRIVLVVSVTVVQENEVLMIKENKPSAINKWNFPSGRIEQGEDILNAACREVKEETGYDVKILETTGVYNFISSSNHQVILFHFIAEIQGGFLKLEEDEIIDSKWISLSEIQNMKNEELRDSKVIRQIVEAMINKKFHPTEVFNEKLH
ncbi:NUDIX hydrolase [Heyndrickxia acidicola]|uniref:NUDIX hydrolase n=1 Tax=Heyndrickxia acidicola TaxID=209389 RepID=A0ABU6MHM5_9BACI|nr:NUDIX hydrolase [Heyndrickxia acidicola]MED1203511.1 NUDIX hydrolase [Heyndrickxia acidicola]